MPHGFSFSINEENISLNHFLDLLLNEVRAIDLLIDGLFDVISSYIFRILMEGVEVGFPNYVGDLAKRCRELLLILGQSGAILNYFGYSRSVKVFQFFLPAEGTYKCRIFSYVLICAIHCGVKVCFDLEEFFEVHVQEV